MTQKKSTKSQTTIYKAYT